MSANGWNPTFSGVSPFSGGHPRPNGPNFTVCLKCNKAFANFYALVEHYRSSHGDETVPTGQSHPLAANDISGHTYRRGMNIYNNPYQHRSLPSSIMQRYHPYIANSYRSMRQQAPVSNPVSNTNHPFLVRTQTPQMLQPQNHPYANNRYFAGTTPTANASHFVINGGRQMPQPQVTPSMSSMYVAGQQAPVSNPVNNTNHPFLVRTQTPQMLQPTNHPFANNRYFAGTIPAANASHFVINGGRQMPQSQVTPSMNSMHVPGQQAPVSNHVTNTNHPFLVRTQTPQMLQQWTHPYANNRYFAGTTSAANTSHFVTNGGRQMPQPQVTLSMSSVHVPEQQTMPDQRPMPSPKSSEEKGFDESYPKAQTWKRKTNIKSLPSKFLPAPCLSSTLFSTS